MGVVLSPDHPYSQELAKWERPPNYDPKNHPYPAMVYMAREKQGRFIVGDPFDEQFSATCYRVVQNEADMARAMDEGWRKTPGAALEYRKKLDDAVSEAAAHRAYVDRNLSDAAKAEAVKAEEAVDGLEHVAEVPQAPRRRGRPRATA